MRYKQLLESYDTSNDPITIDEIKDICNIIADEGGDYKIQLRPKVVTVNGGDAFSLRYLILITNPHMFCEYNIAKRLIDDTLGRFKNKVENMTSTIDNKHYLIILPLEGTIDTISITLTEDESSILNNFLSLDLDRIGFDEDEQDILCDIDPDINLVLNTSQRDILCEYLCLDLDKIGYEEEEIDLLNSVYEKIYDNINYH